MTIDQDKAEQMILSMIQRVESERVPLGMARGAVLREDIVADEAMPPFDRSAMDGYAIKGGDISQPFEMIEEISTGKKPQYTIVAGKCARIYTGGMIPAGAERVIPQEMVRRTENRVQVLEVPKSTFIRYRGEDYSKGEILIQSGRRLGAIEQAIIAGVGVTNPFVSLPVRVAHFTSGDEIVSIEKRPEAGEIRNTNAVLMESLLSESGARLIHQGHLPEDFKKSIEQIKQLGNEGYELLLISGGASVGERDYSKRILQTIGFEIQFESLNLRPGKPLIFGRRGKQLCFAIPGNPVSHFVIYHRLIKILIARLEGEEASLDFREGILSETIDLGKNARATLWPAQVKWENGEYYLTPLKWKSSGDLRGILGTEALIDLYAESPQVMKNDKVRFIKL